MKKQLIILTVLTLLSFPVNTFAEDEISFFSNENTELPGTGGSGTGVADDEEDYEQAPINDYVPLLVLGGIAVYAFSRKKFQLK